MRLIKFLLPLVFLFSFTARAAVTSYDNVFVANDAFSSDFHTRLNANFSKSLTGGINSINAANVVDDSLLEADMADEINPRIRTYEGASCEFVYSGLLPVTDSDLTSDISAGTAYPRGFRITKTSGTSKTYTASRWTFVDVDTSGNFQYSVVTIGAATPSVATNSIRLARVSTDSTTINTVTDLRTTSCTNGPFSNIGSGSGEPSLDDVLRSGAPVRPFSPIGKSPQGFAQGGYISWDTTTTFKVLPGSFYINGEYRATTADTTVPQTADDPANGTSGIDTSAIAASTKYYVYAVGDQSATKPYSISYSTSASSPSGLTNYHLIGSIKTDGSSFFTSQDIVSVNNISDREMPLAWVFFDGSASVITPEMSYNVSGLVDGGSGLYTVTIDSDASSQKVMAVCSGKRSADTSGIMCVVAAATSGTVQIQMRNASDGATDTTSTNVLIFGDGRK